MSRVGENTLYEILGVSSDATHDDIKTAYRKLVKTTHPDAGGTLGVFRSIQNAYNILGDPVTRAQYDREQDLGYKTDSANPPNQDSDGSAAHHSSGNTRDTSQPKKPQPMEDIPQPPAWDGPAPTFIPPRDAPKGWNQVPKWTKIWAICTASFGLLIELIELIGFWATYSLRSDDKGNTAEVVSDFIPRLVGIAIFFAIVAILPYVINKLSSTKRNQKKPPTASNLIAENHLETQEFGEPGRDLSFGRFGPRANLGKTGEQRTSIVIREALLNAVPSARLVNGLKWPGKDHADIDHAVILGNSILLVDSKYMTNGHYWWDNESLYRDGTKLDDFKLGYAVKVIQDLFPSCVVSGTVLIHTPTGKLEDPKIDMARIPAAKASKPHYRPVHVVSSREFLEYLPTFIRQSNQNTVNIYLLHKILHMSNLL